MLASTPYFEVTFWLLQNIRLIHDIELFITCGILIICVYAADDVKESISVPVEFVMSSFH